MANNQKISDQFSNGLNLFFHRVSEFFHIFDLPFFVSGFITLGALYYLTYITNTSSIFSISISDWLYVLIILLLSYVLGLISFSIGRNINSIFLRFNKISKYLERSLKAHGLIYLIESTGYQIEYTDLKKKEKEINLYHFYTRLWQDLAQYRSDSLAFNHLSRYWALAALYDGLAFSFLVWGLVLVLSLYISPIIIDNPANLFMTKLMSSVSFLFSFFSFVQGVKYLKYQIEDLVASIAASKSPIIK